MLRVLLPLCVSIGLLTACMARPDYDSPRALADRLAEQDPDLACASYSGGPGGGSGPVSGANCTTASGHELGLQVYDDSDTARSEVANADVIYDGTTTIALVHAGRWLVAVDDEDTAEAVQAALGGDLTIVGGSGK